MGKRVLFFSCEPGGAEVLIPAIRLVQADARFETVVAGYGHALARFSRKQVDCGEIPPVRQADFSLFDRHAPALLITSATSLPAVDGSEHCLWQQAKQRGVPSLAFLDQWQNYTARFSGVNAHERLAYLPDRINCINEIGRGEMIREGFDETRLVALGHPYLSSLTDDLPALAVGRLRNSLHLSAHERVALFVSEPIQEHYGDQCGYDQYRVLDYFLSNLSREVEPPAIIVKLHPKDSRASFQSLLDRFSGLPLQIIGDELSPLECLAVSDFVFGMTSIMLIEAYVLGKRVVSLQPGLRVDDPMVLSRHNLIPLVRDAEPRNLFELDAPPPGRFNVEFAADAFLSLLERM